MKARCADPVRAAFVLLNLLKCRPIDRCFSWSSQKSVQAHPRTDMHVYGIRFAPLYAATGGDPYLLPFVVFQYLKPLRNQLISIQSYAVRSLVSP